MTHCPKCGTEMPDEAEFCMKCGRRISAEIPSSGFPIAGGILVILAASFAFVNGLIYLHYSICCNSWDLAHIQQTSIYYPWYYSGWSLILGIFCIIGFAWGLVSGILSLTRKNYVVAVTGASFVIAGGAIGLMTPFTILLGMACFILGVIGLIFIAISKEEFTNKT